MRKQILLSGAAAAAVVALAGPAFAADPMPVVVAPTTVAAYTAAPPRTWTGGYVGGNAAMLRGNVHDNASCFDGEDLLTFAWVSTFTGTVPTGEDCEEVLGAPWVAGYGSIDNNEGFSIGAGPLEVSPVSLSGYSIGGQIGYLRQLGKGPNGFVIGGEVSANWSSAQGTLFAAGEFPEAFVGNYNVNAYGTATLRAGFALGPALIYAEGGLAIASLSYNDNIGLNASDIAHGYVYGGGIEGRISQNVTLFFEYNRIHINNVQFMGAEGPLGIISTYMYTNVDLNVFKTGFNIHFGGDH